MLYAHIYAGKVYRVFESRKGYVECFSRAATSRKNTQLSPSSSQFIGRPQTFVELQLRFKLHFYTKKMQFET